MRLFISFVALGLCSCTSTDLMGLQPTLKIVGTTTVTSSLISNLAKAHRKSVGTVNFEIRAGDDNSAMTILLDGEADMAALNRPHLPVEQEQAVANGYSLARFGARNILAVNAIAISVHPQNPIEALTYDQTIGIFCSGEIDNWSLLGFEDAPIHLVVPSPRDGGRMIFEDFFCGNDGMVQKATVQEQSLIQKTLSENPHTISIGSFSNRTGKLLGLRAGAEIRAIMPTQANVIRGMYPLAHDVFLYTAGPARGHMREFVNWIHSPAGQEIVDTQRFVPLYLRPERMNEPRPLRETIHFEPGSTQPTQRSLARLSLLIKDLQDRAGEYSHVVLEGYTDTTEPNPINLSSQRSETVRGLLEKEMPGNKYEVIPRGVRHPIAPNETPYGRQRNRRVQVYLEPK